MPLVRWSLKAACFHTHRITKTFSDARQGMSTAFCAVTAQRTSQFNSLRGLNSSSTSRPLKLSALPFRPTLLARADEVIDQAIHSPGISVERLACDAMTKDAREPPVWRPFR